MVTTITATVNRYRLWIVAFALVCMATVALMARPAYAGTTVTVNNAPGDDTAAIQTAIDQANTGTEASPDVIQLTSDPNPGNAPDSSECYTISPQSGTTGIALDNEDDNILITSTGANQACLMRWAAPNLADDPSTDNLAWFRFTGDHNTNQSVGVRFSNLRFEGRGGGFLADDDLHVDIGISAQPTMSDYTVRADYVQNVKINDVTWMNLTGVCVFVEHVYGLRMTGDRCLDNTKGGYTLFATWGKTVNFDGEPYNYIHNTSAVDTGDDGLAFNSCTVNHATQCARAGNFEVNRSFFRMDPNADSGSALIGRGGANLNIHNTHAVNAGGSTGGTCRLNVSTNGTGPVFNLDNNDITNSRCDGGSDNHAAFVNGDTCVNGSVSVSNNDHNATVGTLDSFTSNGDELRHTVPGTYGIFKTAGTALACFQSTASNIYVPNNATWNKNF